MTDREIIAQLLLRDEQTTHWFFYQKCRPLLISVMRNLFDQPVEYDEMVNELYALLMENDARRLRQFDYRSSLCQWLKVVALRHFGRLRRDQAGLCLPDALPEGGSDEQRRRETELFVAQLLERMDNRRHAYVIRRLMLDQADHTAVAEELGVTVDNLYNIKRRAFLALAAMVRAEEQM